MKQGFKIKVLRFKSNRGFTIAELLVAISIFVIVVAIAVGVFVQSLKTQSAVLALMAANDNASFAIEQIIREVRTGTAFETAGSILRFTNASQLPVTYELINKAIVRNGEAITADNITVDYLIFDRRGGPNEGTPTLITIKLGVSAQGINLKGFVTNLQTSVAARVLGE